MVAVIAAQGQAFLQQLGDGVHIAVCEGAHLLTCSGESGGDTAQTDLDDLEAVGLVGLLPESAPTDSQGVDGIDDGGDLLRQGCGPLPVAGADDGARLLMPAALQGQGMGHGGVEVEKFGIGGIFRRMAGKFAHQGLVMLGHGVARQVVLEELDQGILVQQHLAHIGGVAVDTHRHAGQIVEQAQIQEGLGIVIAYTSVYGNTRGAVELLAERLRAKGAPKVVVHDLARCDMAEAISDAFRYGKLVLATTTYNGDVFPFMREFIHHLTERNYRNRTVGLMENGSWAPVAAKVMTKMLEGSKDLTFAPTTVKIFSALDDNSRAQIEALADAMK